jgi:pimeloyl-ACP methyl ester carboxylesterase
VEKTPELRIVSANGEDLAVWEWPGDGPPFVLAHATGFHGRCWDEIVRMFPERRCLAIDKRGHGRSSKPEPPYHWRLFGRDLAAVMEHFGVNAAIGIGHSSGGHTTVQAAALRPETYRALLLIDPTIFREKYYGTAAPDASGTLRRRNEWESAEEMFERFESRPPFAGWRKQILRDYCEYGLLPKNGKFVLACPPAVEASIYHESKRRESNIYPEIASVSVPVVVMRADRERQPGVFELGASPTAPDLAAHFAKGRDVVLQGATHYIAMESPERVAEEIRRLAE